MLKKARAAGLLAAAAGTIMLMGGTAYATSGHGDHNEVNSWTNEEDNDWNGAINILNDNNIQIPIGICGNDINILGINLPIASPDVVGNCSSATAIEND
ncbi:MAG TPA: hypothetical protein VIL00_14525 [Pseudonocardiaceae bacterium]